MSEIPVLTIDGPSGSGKGTVSTLVARQLGWHMLDSGALYRLVGLGAELHNIPLEDEAALAQQRTITIPLARDVIQENNFETT